MIKDLKIPLFKKCNSEKDYQKKFMVFLREYYPYCYKIPDQGVDLKPYDGFVVGQEGTEHFELKISKDGKLPKLRAQQEAILLKIASCSQPAWVIVFYNEKTYIYDIKNYIERLDNNLTNIM